MESHLPNEPKLESICIERLVEAEFKSNTTRDKDGQIRTTYLCVVCARRCKVNLRYMKVPYEERK